MQGSTHAATGIATGLAVASIRGLDWKQTAICAAIGGVSSLIPDWLQINLPGASSQIKGVFGHRGISHWVLSAVGVTYLLMRYNAPKFIYTAFFFGWLSHITLDMLSNGVPALWPFPRITLAHVKSGGTIDKMIGGASLIIGLFQVLY